MTIKQCDVIVTISFLKNKYMNHCPMGLASAGTLWKPKKKLAWKRRTVFLTSPLSYTHNITKHRVNINTSRRSKRFFWGKLKGEKVVFDTKKLFWDSCVSVLAARNLRRVQKAGIRGRGRGGEETLANKPQVFENRPFYLSIRTVKFRPIIFPHRM